MYFNKLEARQNMRESSENKNSDEVRGRPVGGTWIGQSERRSKRR